MDKLRDKSINKMIKTTFAIIIVIMSLSFVYSNIMKNKIVKEYNQFIKTNIKLSDLSLGFNNSWSYFESYIKNKDPEKYKKFKESNEQVKKIMNDIGPYVKQNKDSGIFFTNLTYMFDWYENQTQRLINTNELDPSSYQRLMKIKLMSFYISKHCNSLISSYLQYSDSYYSGVLDKYKFLDTNIYILLLFMICISIFLIKIVMDDIIKTIDKLSISVQQLSDANWDIPDISGNIYKELKGLIITFNHMKNSIRTYIEKLNKSSEAEINYQNEKIKNIEKDKIIRETQLKALQMQTNPHFLFNNLNTVSRMAMFEEASKTVDLIDAVSQILRYNLLNKDNLVTLEEEIKNVKSYILIQKTKYEDRIKFDFQIQEKTGGIFIPPMSIQILVENAIKHGFSGHKKKGCILISAKIVGEYGLISVEDNGSGIPEDDLIALNKGKEISKKCRKSTGLGIKNIQSRLELYYGRNDLLEIKSNFGFSTRVSFFIPIKESEIIAKNLNSRG